MPRSSFLMLGSFALVLVLAGLWIAIVPRSADSLDALIQVNVSTSVVAPTDLSDVAAAKDTRTSADVAATEVSSVLDTRALIDSNPPDADAFLVHVVRDEDDQPIVGARTLFEDPTLPGLPPEQRTDAQGIAHWNLLGERNWVVYVVVPGRTPVSRGVSKDAGSVTVRMRIRREIAVRLVDERGAAFSPRDLGLDPSSAGEIRLTAAAACDAPGTTFDAGAVLPFRASPASWNGPGFAWNLVLESSDSACVQAMLGDRILASQWVAPGTNEVSLAVRRTEIDRFSATFVVRALSSEGGRALENIAVIARTTSGLAVERRTDSDGRARFDGVLAAEFDLEAAGSDRERTRQHVVRPLDGEVIVHMKAGRVIRGLVVGETGHPFGEATLALYRASQAGSRVQPIAEVKADSNGVFEFTGVTLDAVVLIPAWSYFGPRELPLELAGNPSVHIVEAGGDALGVRFIMWAHDELVLR